MVRKTEGHVSGGLRPAFTLVELLVVIIIIAILAAIAVPAVMRATATAQNARIKSEIDMLHMAIQQYKNEYGSFPPCADVPSGAILKHVSRIFPRMPAANMNVGLPTAMQPNTAIYLWLSGYNTDDPTNPFVGTAKKMFDFDTSRVSSNQFHVPSKPSSPYIYIDSAHYPLYDSTATSPAGPFGGIYYSHRTATKTVPNFVTPTQPYANPDSFQILCAGRDEKFGTDDDMSNFWPGTRKDYLDSLK
jgi:prepilin-type N-terminal cleavage/methylation domain-containing protein